jgi:hypothetical protein
MMVIMPTASSYTAVAVATRRAVGATMPTSTHATPRPMLLKTTNPSDLMLLLLGHQRETARIEFGAHQCIIVRDDTARRHLPEELQVCICACDAPL